MEEMREVYVCLQQMMAKYIYSLFFPPHIIQFKQPAGEMALGSSVTLPPRYPILGRSRLSRQR